MTSLLPILRRAVGRKPEPPPAPEAAVLDARLQEAVAAAPVGIARVALNGRWIAFNDACAAILGYTRLELSRLTLHDLTNRDDARREVALLREMLEDRARSYRITKRVADKNGGTRVIHLTATVIRGNDAQNDAFLYVIEAAAWRAEVDPLDHRAAAHVIDQLAWTAIVWSDAEGTITGWNSGAERLFGRTRGEAIGRNRRELYRDLDRKAGMPEDELAIATSRGRFTDTGWRRKGDGSMVRVQSSIVRLTPDGTMRGFVEEVTADTETVHRQKAEASLDEHRLQIRKKVTDIEIRAAETQRQLAVMSTSLREEVERRKSVEAELEALRGAHAELLMARSAMVFDDRSAMVFDEIEIPLDPLPELEPAAVPVRQGAAAMADSVKDWRDADGRSATDLILEAAGGNRSGVLVLQSHNHRAEIFFEHGRIAATASDDPASLLGEWMVRRGLITETARQQALEMSDFGEIAFGRSLLTLGVLTKSEIITAVREKIESDVERCAERLVVRWAFVHSATTRTLVPIGVDARELRAMQTYVALPGGKRYHLSTCKSLKAGTPILLTASAAAQHGLAPCRKCLPVETPVQKPPTAIAS
jgi:PAS domain S-box-containing protein